MSFAMIWISASFAKCRNSLHGHSSNSPVIADVAAGILAAPGVPISITYRNEIKIMEVYLDKLLEIAKKHGSLTWGFGTFTTQTPQVICELTQANGELTGTGRLTAAGKEVI